MVCLNWYFDIFLWCSTDFAWSWIWDDSDDHHDATSDDDSEFLSKDDLKMFGNGKKPKKPPADENDIVSDIYSTAFSKVPKVSALLSEHCYCQEQLLMEQD